MLPMFHKLPPVKEWRERIRRRLDGTLKVKKAPTHLGIGALLVRGSFSTAPSLLNVVLMTTIVAV